MTVTKTISNSRVKPTATSTTSMMELTGGRRAAHNGKVRLLGEISLSPHFRLAEEPLKIVRALLEAARKRMEAHGPGR